MSVLHCIDYYSIVCFITLKVPLFMYNKSTMHLHEYKTHYFCPNFKQELPFLTFIIFLRAKCQQSTMVELTSQFIVQQHCFCLQNAYAS